MRTHSNLFDRIRRIGPLVAATLALAWVGIARAEDAASAPRSAAQLEQLVAPIALYPDALLSQVLMASTYPLEVVQAARWAQANSGVTGKALEDAMQSQSWDPSVKALTAVPQTLQMMNDKLDWTRELGDAFLAQQSDVLDAVQRLRARADAAGNLKTTEQQRVTKASAPAGTTTQPSGAAPAPSGPVYTIESTNPDEYYVPIYDPGVVYGAWPYPEYAPFYWYPPGYAGGRLLSFAAGVLAGAAIWGGIDWWRHRVNINVNRFNQFNRTNIVNRNWVHNPAHRGAVPYRDRNVAQRFGNPAQAAAREAFRGKADAGRRDLAGNRGAGQPGVAHHRGAAAVAAGAGIAAGAAGQRAAAARAARQTHAAQPRPAARAREGGGGHRVAQHRPVSRAPAARPARSYAPRAHVAARGGGMRGGGMRGGGMRGGGMRGGGRRSDIRLKHDITLLGHLDNGLGFYRFVYNGGDTAYVGVMAQEVQRVMPEAVVTGQDGYLRVLYDRLGMPFQTYDQWLASGARLPAARGWSSH
jgi:hypothetical protein